MNSFQAKIGWKWMRKREIKIIVLFRSYPMQNRKFQKGAKKYKKNQKIPLWLHFMPKQAGKGYERQKIKIILSFCSYPTRNRKLQKKKAKKFKNTIMVSFQAKTG